MRAAPHRPTDARLAICRGRAGRVLRRRRQRERRRARHRVDHVRALRRHDRARSPTTTGKPLVVNFFAVDVRAVHHARCRRFEQVHQELGDEVAFLGLDVQDTRRGRQGLRRADRRHLGSGPRSRRPAHPQARVASGCRRPCSSTATGRIVVAPHRRRSRRTSSPASSTASSCSRDRRAVRPRLHHRDGRHGEPVRLRHAAGVPVVLPRLEATDAPSRDGPRPVARALVVGAAVSAGFVADVRRRRPRRRASCRRSVYDVAPWISLVIGVALVVGWASPCSAGFDLTVAPPPARPGRPHRRRRVDVRLRRLVRDRVARVHAAAVRGAASAGTFARREPRLRHRRTSCAYAVGMALVLVALTRDAGAGPPVAACACCAARCPTSTASPAGCWSSPAPTSRTTALRDPIRLRRTGGDSIVDRSRAGRPTCRSWVQDQGGHGSASCWR